MIETLLLVRRPPPILKSLDMEENEDGSPCAAPRFDSFASIIRFLFRLRLGSLPFFTLTWPAPCIPASGSSECVISPASLIVPSMVPVIFPRASGNALSSFSMFTPLSLVLVE